MYKGKTRSPVTVIIFSLLTCGIYYLYWLYQAKTDVNGLLGREELSTGLYIAAILVPFVYLLLWYKIDNALADEICPPKNVPYNKNFFIWLILTFVGGIGSIVAMFQIQEALNKHWELN
ncbi:MAG: DUF4234 domain-containing protein [Oscillospiraceae bacterium]|nr:DUF4234 domain-containing protein [Oscillospiraceae bacterium]